MNIIAETKPDRVAELKIFIDKYTPTQHRDNFVARLNKCKSRTEIMQTAWLMVEVFAELVNREKSEGN